MTRKCNHRGCRRWSRNRSTQYCKQHTVAEAKLSSEAEPVAKGKTAHTRERNAYFKNFVFENEEAMETIISLVEK